MDKHANELQQVTEYLMVRCNKSLRSYLTACASEEGFNRNLANETPEDI